MNVTFRLATEELEKQFVKESTAAGLDGLKGHRSVGGMRASIYNAFPEEGVDALVAFMREFERKAAADPSRRRLRAAMHIVLRRIKLVLASTLTVSFAEDCRAFFAHSVASSSPPS